MRRTVHLKRKLRNPVAKLGEVKIFDYHIGRAAIGGHSARAFDSLNFGIGQLIFRAVVDTHRQAIARQLYAVCPDPADMGDLPFTKADRKVDRISVVHLLRLGRAAFATAAHGHCLKKL